MYRNKGNTAANPRRKKMPKPATRATYIAESITARITEWREWSFEDYGIANNAEMMELVTKKLRRCS